MDVSSNSGNSIEEVEGDIRTEHPEWLPNGKFSPGHRLRIRLFVEEVQKSFTPKVTLGKGKRVCGRRDAKGKKPKIEMVQCDNCEEWFHCHCLKEYVASVSWFCQSCVTSHHVISH